MRVGWDNISFECRNPPTAVFGRNDCGLLRPTCAAQRAGRTEDREHLKPSFVTIFIEHPFVTLFLVLLFGVLVFGRVLP